MNNIFLQNAAKYRLAISCILIIMALLSCLLFQAQTQSPLANEGFFSGYLAEQQVSAAKAFTVAKGLNATISLLQSVDVGFSLGASFTVSPAEVLDPANDIVENISDWLLIASGAILLERLLLSVNPFIVFTLLLPLSLTLLALSFWMPTKLRLRFSQLGRHGITLSFAILILIPASVCTSKLLEQSLLKSTIETNQLALQTQSKAVDEISNEILHLSENGTLPPTTNQSPTSSATPPPHPNDNAFKQYWPTLTKSDHSLLSQAKDKWHSITSKYSYAELKTKIETISNNLENKLAEMTENFITLLAIFLLNTVIIPVMTLVVIWQLLKAGMRPQNLSITNE